MEQHREQPSGDAGAHVHVRFTDDDVLEGEVRDLDLDHPEFELVIADSDNNNRRAMIPLPAVKCLTMARRKLEQPMDTRDLQKVALRFRDGDVIKGLVAGSVRRARHGVSIELVNPAGDAVEFLGIPYESLKAVFYLSTWDCRPPAPSLATTVEPGAPPPLGSPLLKLLSAIRRAAELRDRGEISDGEYRRRRQGILDRI
jgi:hypothetical protein